MDPASYKADESPDILSYIAKPLANVLKSKYPESLVTCSCKPATTCSAVGCFTTNKCIKIKCNLLDDFSKIENVEIAFRVVETLGTNDIIIGLSDVKRYDLTSVFRHLYIEEGHVSPNISAERCDEGVDATDSNTSSVESPLLFLQEAKSSRRSPDQHRLPQEVQARKVIRAGARRNAPARRSDRLKDVKTGFSCQAEEGSQPSTPKSLSALELHCC